MLEHCEYCGGQIRGYRLSHDNPRECRNNLLQLLAQSNHALRGALAGRYAQFDWKKEARDALEAADRIVRAQAKATDAGLAQKAD